MSDAERRRIIESCVMRPLPSLRDLRATDVRFILERLESRQPHQTQTGGSSWDDRDGDTWIDRL